MIPKNLAIAGPERSALVLVPAATHDAGASVADHGDGAHREGHRPDVRCRAQDEVASEFTVEEVAHILQASHEEGLVLSEQFGRLDAAIEFSDKDASDVGVRLADLVTVGLDTTPDDIERLVAKRAASPATRWPAPTGPSSAICTSRTSSSPTRRSGCSRSRPSASGGWPTFAGPTRSRACCGRCSRPDHTWREWSPTTGKWSVSSSSRTSSSSLSARSRTPVALTRTPPRAGPSSGEATTGTVVASGTACPRQDSNLRSRLRRAVLYPLSYGAGSTAQSGEGRTLREWVAAYSSSMESARDPLVLVCDDTASIRRLIRINPSRGLRRRGGARRAGGGPTPHRPRRANARPRPPRRPHGTT